MKAAKIPGGTFGGVINRSEHLVHSRISCSRVLVLAVKYSWSCFASFPRAYPLLPILFSHTEIFDRITVEIIDQNRCVVTGLLGWEYSGFYPDYYEAVRCTDCLTLYEDNDWFLFLPDCISPKRYAHWWLLDRVRETRSM